jgi:hypothetical protein
MNGYDIVVRENSRSRSVTNKKTNAIPSNNDFNTTVPGVFKWAHDVKNCAKSSVSKSLIINTCLTGVLKYFIKFLISNVCYLLNNCYIKCFTYCKFKKCFSCQHGLQQLEITQKVLMN